MRPNVFVTYNEKSRLGKQTALRLQTIAHLYGFKIFLPDRYSGNAEESTSSKIDVCDYCIIFALENVSKSLLTEINYAIAHNKTLIVIYHDKVGPTLRFDKEYRNLIMSDINFDENNLDEQLKKFLIFLKTIITKK